MEMLECNGFSFIFGCCSTVKTLCGKEIPKQLTAMYICQGIDDYHMYSLVVDAHSNIQF